MQEINKEDKFYHLMQKGNLHLHSNKLEDDIMYKIQQRNLYKRRVSKNLKISIILLSLDIVLGFVLNNTNGKAFFYLK